MALGPIVFGPILALIRWFQSNGLIADPLACPVCSTPSSRVNMILEPREDVSDKYRWRCTQCQNRLCLRKGSFYYNSRLPLQKWMILMHCWAYEYPVTTAAVEASVSEGAAVQVYQYLREVCSTTLINTPIILGGNQTIVQVDESLFRHKPKYHRGRATSSEQWVFGLVDTSTKPATGYMELVQSRDAQTLLPIIQAHTAPGTIVHSDQWRAYSQVPTLPTVSSYATVNHSVNFVDPVTGVHTQHIESYWSRVKRP